MPAPVASRRARLQTPFAMQAAASSDPLAITSVRMFGSHLRLQTRAGIVGWGELTAPGGASLLRSAAGALLNQSASAYTVIEKSLAADLAPAAVMAMLDCLGKHSKAPVYQVLGGPTRFKVRAMALVNNASEVKQARALGHRSFSLRIPAPEFPNSGKLYVNRIRALADDARAAAGAGCDFVLDCAGQLAAGDAQQLAAEFERFHLLWLDEPCRHGNASALRKISDESVTPIGLGRHCREGAEFQDLLREEAVDIVRPSMQHFSIARIRRIAALAETYYIAIAPYHRGGTLATVAALHAAASMPNFFIQELPPRAPDDPVRGFDTTVHDGYLHLPTGPGLGVTVDEAAIARTEVRV